MCRAAAESVGFNPMTGNEVAWDIPETRLIILNPHSHLLIIWAPFNEVGCDPLQLDVSWRQQEEWACREKNQN